MVVTYTKLLDTILIYWHSSDFRNWANEKLEWRVERKKEIYLRYKKQLKDLEQVKFFQQDLKCTTPWFIDCIVDDRQSLIKELVGHGIGTRTMYPPINSQNAYKISGDYPVQILLAVMEYGFLHQAN